jgi:hypothetical protein
MPAYLSRLITGIGYSFIALSEGDMRDSESTFAQYIYHPLADINQLRKSTAVKRSQGLREPCPIGVILSTEPNYLHKGLLTCSLHLSFA